MFCAELEIFVQNDNCQTARSLWDSLVKESCLCCENRGNGASWFLWDGGWSRPQGQVRSHCSFLAATAEEKLNLRRGRWNLSVESSSDHDGWNSGLRPWVASHFQWELIHSPMEWVGSCCPPNSASITATAKPVWAGSLGGFDMECPWASAVRLQPVQQHLGKA